MEIILGKTAGFCFGVKNAVDKTENILEEYNEIECIGEIVHNSQVVKSLENKGLKVINSIEEAKTKNVIIRAHGVTKETYNFAQRNKIKLYDYTCPKVLKIHEIVDEYRKKGYFIILIGVNDHPEVIGTMSYAGKNSYLIEKEEDINNTIKKLNPADVNKVLIIAQTTFSLEKFNKYSEIIKEEIGKMNRQIDIEIKNTICSATKIRQEETIEISKHVDAMIIIGGKNSSNTKKLYDIANINCKNTIIVETKNELTNNQLEELRNYEKIGIMAGASTPKESIKEVINTLKNVT